MNPTRKTNIFWLLILVIINIQEKQRNHRFENKITTNDDYTYIEFVHELNVTYNPFDKLLHQIQRIQSMNNIQNDAIERHIRNLRITDVYYELSILFNEFLFNNNEYFNDTKPSNWMTVGVWASNMVGTHIRGQTLYYYLLSILPPQFRTSYAMSSVIFNYVMQSQIEITSLYLSVGNIMVSNDIAFYSALLGKIFYNLTETAQSLNQTVINHKLQEFKAYFKADQYMLFEAYKHYTYVRYYKIFNLTAKDIRQYMIYANLRIGFYEQTQLQSPLDNAISDWNIRIPYFNILPITQYVAKILTQYVFELCVGNQCHSIGKNIDIKSESISDFVGGISYEPLKQLLMEFYLNQNKTDIDMNDLINGNGATNWLNLNDRMRFIVALFLFHINDDVSHLVILTEEQKNIIWQTYYTMPNDII